MKTIIFLSLMFMMFCGNSFSQTSDTTLFPWTYFFMNLNSDTSSYGPGTGEPSRDLVASTVWLTNELGGGFPYDIIYINDVINENDVKKIFVYTERKLVIIDEDSKEITGSIDISKYGSQSSSKIVASSGNLTATSREKHLAYNYDKHELYCLTQDLHIKIIDPLNEEIIGDISQHQYPSFIFWAILKYDPISQQIFLSYTYSVCQNFVSKLISFSTDNYSSNYILTFNRLYDFSFNPVYDLLYLSQ